MNISEERLKELVLRILKELETEKGPSVWMMCTSQWDERFPEFLKLMEQSGRGQVYPVIPKSWAKNGYESILRSFKSCHGIVYRTCERSADLEHAVTVFPVVPRDVIVKTALCLSDTFETSWIASCIEKGSRVVFLNSGLMKFSGKEPQPYINKILSYYRQVLEYGIEISDGNGLSEIIENRTQVMAEASQPVTQVTPVRRKNRVITASNVEQYAAEGILALQQGDIVTDLAKDRAKFLKIVIK